jgi:hypothetical protein
VQGLVGHIDLFRVNPDTHTIAVENPSEIAGLTRHTFGSSFVHATHILDLEGKPAIIFVFAVSKLILTGVLSNPHALGPAFVDAMHPRSNDGPGQDGCSSPHIRGFIPVTSPFLLGVVFILQGH